MREKKIASKKDMTVAELARTTNTAFGDLETRINRQFHDIHMNFATKADLRETEHRLLDVLNRIENKIPDFETLKNDVADLSGRVAKLEKNF